MSWRMDYEAVMNGMSGLDELVVCIMTRRQACMAIGWARPLEYDSTWVGGDAPLDEVHAMLCALVGVKLVDVLDKLDTIIELLGSLGSVGGGGSGDCCLGVSGKEKAYVDKYPSIYNSPVPDSVIDAGWATDSGDYAGMDNYVCAAADLMIDSMLHKVDQFQELWAVGIGGIGAVSAILGYVYTGGVGLVVATLIADAVAVYDVLTGVLDEVVFDELRAKIEEMRDTVGCAMKGGLSSEDVLGLIESLLADENVFVRGMIRHMGWEPVIAAIYGGEDDEGRGVPSVLGDPVACDKDCSNTAGFSLVGDVLGSSWTSGDSVFTGLQLRVRSVFAVVGIEPAWRVSGGFDDSGHLALVSVNVNKGTLEDGGGGQECYYIDESGNQVDVDVDVLNAGTQFLCRSFHIVSWRGFNDPPDQFQIEVGFDSVIGL